MRELWINNELIDLYEEQPIAITKQVNKLNELKDRQADHTNRFKIPPTGNNLRITGLPDRPSSLSINPYTKLSCRYVENGSEIISNGITIIESYNGDIEITCYSGIFDFFDQLGESSIRELDLSEADHVYNLDGVEAGFADGSKYCYPLIQWGAVSNNNNIVDIRYQMPAVPLSFIVDKIFEGTTFNKSGSVFDLDSYNSIWLPVVEDSLIDEEDVLLSYSMEQHLAGIITSTPGAFDKIIQFGENTPSNGAFTSSAGWWDQSRYRWTARHKVTVNVDVVVYMNTPFSTSPGATTEVVKVYVRKNGNSTTPVGQYQRLAFDGDPIDPTTVAIIEIRNLILNPGDYLDVYYRDPQFNDTIYPYDNSSPPNYSKFAVEAINTIELGQPLSMSNLVPDIKQKDIIKFIQNKYALIPQIDYLTRTVNFVRFSEIASRKDLGSRKVKVFGITLTLPNTTYDWSDKLYFNPENPKDPNNPKIRFRFDSYAQKNYMRWIQDDDRGEVGDGIIYVDDQTLPDNTDLFEMPFAASIQEVNLKGNLGVDIKRWTLNDDLEYEKTETVQPRVLMLRDYVPTGSPAEDLEYTDGTNTVTMPGVKIAYFTDSQQEYDLNFENIIQQHYSELQQVLTKTKIVEAKFKLSENEFKNIDFFKPVYVKHFGDYFYINSIPNFINGRLASVELVRL